MSILSYALLWILIPTYLVRCHEILCHGGSEVLAMADLSGLEALANLWPKQMGGRGSYGAMRYNKNGQSQAWIIYCLGEFLFMMNEVMLACMHAYIYTDMETCHACMHGDKPVMSHACKWHIFCTVYTGICWLIIRKSGLNSIYFAITHTSSVESST